MGAAGRSLVNGQWMVSGYGQGHNPGYCYGGGSVELSVTVTIVTVYFQLTFSCVHLQLFLWAR